MGAIFQQRDPGALECRVRRYLRLVLAVLTLVLVLVAVWKFCAGQSLSGLCAVLSVWISFRLATR